MPNWNEDKTGIRLFYVQKTGNVYEYDGTLLGTGAAGHGKGKNNPDMQGVRGHAPDPAGPLPVGFYTIDDPVNHPRLGPMAMQLLPFPDNEMFGRSGFFMHGFSTRDYENSSDGCICQNANVRQRVIDYPSEIIQVVATETHAALLFNK